MTTPNPSGSSFAIGTIIGGTYRILAFLGQGGMGHVFKVEHVMMAKILALKALRPEQVSGEVWQRFRTEAQAIARLSHNNIVKIYDMSQTEDGLPYYTMDLLSGQSLSDYMDEAGKLSEQEALPIFRQVCSALGYAHDHGIVHRDVKPANIMLTDGNGNGTSPVVKLVDFGIAKLQSYDNNIGQGLTRPGEVFGSPLYMSPEQASGRQLDYRTDMYSLGVTMFQALTGKPPLAGKTAMETVAMHQSTAAPTLHQLAPNDRFSDELEYVVARLLAKQPEQRFSSLYDVEKHLQQLETGTSEGKIRPKKITAARKRNPADYLEPLEIDDEQIADFGVKKYILLPLGLLAVLILISAGAYTFYVQHQANLAASMVKQKPIFTGEQSITPEQDHVLKTDSEYSYEMKPQQRKTIEQFLRQRKAPYSHLSADRRVLIFDFPDDIDLGIVSYRRNGSSEYIKTVAKGRVKIPAGMINKFDAGNCTKLYPDLIKFFRPDDFIDLSLREMAEKNPRIAPNVLRLIDIKQLDLSQSLVDDSDLRWLDNMTRVSVLNIGHTSISGDGFRNSKIFARLKAFEIDGMKNITAVLEKIPTDRHLLFISLGSSKLTTKDFALLAKLAKLERLSLTNANLKDEYLAQLTQMQSLQELNLYRCAGLTSKALRYLKNLKKLRLLCLPAAVFSPQEVSDLQTALPMTRIIEA